MGTQTEQIIPGTIKELENTDFGEPLHSLIIPGKLHDIEKEILKHYKK